MARESGFFIAGLASCLHAHKLVQATAKWPAATSGPLPRIRWVVSFQFCKFFSFSGKMSDSTRCGGERKIRVCVLRLEIKRARVFSGRQDVGQLAINREIRWDWSASQPSSRSNNSPCDCEAQGRQHRVTAA